MKSDKNILSETNVNECTSCQFCESICPVNAISFSLNEEGFYRPKVSDTCVECGLCQKYCYKFKSPSINEDILNQIECYSAKSKDKNNLNTSASGGVSTILFKKLLKEDYKIVGVTFNVERNQAETIIIEKDSDLECLKGSKYMQTRNNDIFKEIINTKNKYAIIGTPCSIYPISLWAKKMNQEDRFMFVDFFCHGTPSMLLWKKYSNNYLMKNNVRNIKFRSKHYGWHEFCHEFITDKKSIYTNFTEKDPFFTMFFDNQFLNRSCYECKCRDSFEYCDIRLGDFWGSKFDIDIEGVSAVLLVTNKAKDLFIKVKNNLETSEEKFDEITKEQAYKTNYTFDERKRKKYLTKFNTALDINEIFKDYTSNYSIKAKVKRNTKIFIKSLPNSLVLRIKKFYHSN